MSEQDDECLKTTTLIVSARVSLEADREPRYAYSPIDKRRGVFLS